jgi:hypothetical protein
MQQNAKLLGFACEAIDEGIFDLHARNHQEEALDAAARNQVGGFLVDGARLGHNPRYRKRRAAPASRHLRAKRPHLQANAHTLPRSSWPDGQRRRANGHVQKITRGRVPRGRVPPAVHAVGRVPPAVHAVGFLLRPKKSPAVGFRWSVGFLVGFRSVGFRSGSGRVPVLVGFLPSGSCR